MQSVRTGLSQHRLQVGTRAGYDYRESGRISSQGVAVPYLDRVRYRACEAAVSNASAGE
jgi:hypothetical protein